MVFLLLPICSLCAAALPHFASNKPLVEVGIQRSEWVISINLTPCTSTIARQQKATWPPTACNFLLVIYSFTLNILITPNFLLCTLGANFDREESLSDRSSSYPKWHGMAIEVARCQEHKMLQTPARCQVKMSNCDGFERS